jgi:hypothetical protein
VKSGCRSVERGDVMAPAAGATPTAAHLNSRPHIWRPNHCHSLIAAAPSQHRCSDSPTATPKSGCGRRGWPHTTSRAVPFAAATGLSPVACSLSRAFGPGLSLRATHLIPVRRVTDRARRLGPPIRLRGSVAKHPAQDGADAFPSIRIIKLVRHTRDDRSPDVREVRQAVEGLRNGNR